MHALKRIVTARSHSRGTVTLSHLWEDAFQQAKAPFVRGDDVKRVDYKIDMWAWLRESADRHDVRLEMIDGQVRKYSSPSAQHQYTSLSISAKYRSVKHWCVLPAVDVWYDADNVVCHDISGWRSPVNMHVLKANCKQTAITIKPDWAVEIISPGSRYDDQPRRRASTEEKTSGKIKRKFDLCARFGVRHYWLVDPIRGTIEVHQHDKPGESGSYRLLQKCEYFERSVTLQPFDIELDLSQVFSLDK